MGVLKCILMTDVFSARFLDLYWSHPAAGQSKQRAAHLLHFGKHTFESDKLR